MPWLDDSTLDHLKGVLAEGEESGARYRIREAIGEGGMGAVYLADDTALDRPVAMKVIRGGRVGADAVDRMLREARVIARLEHPGIVPVHDVGRLPDGRVFYVMKWVRGRRLDEYFDAKATIAERLRVFERVCETVAFAHARGVIHRDLKPQNIMVGEFGEVLVLDWGVAKWRPGVLAADDHDATVAVPPAADDPMPTARHTAHGTILGTPAYMSPEQARGEVDQVDERSDVFALGGVLYFLLTSQAPRAGAPSGEGVGQPPIVPPRQRERAVSRRLEAICLKALSTDPGQRYASASGLSTDVTRFLNGQAVAALREGLPERLVRWAWWYRAPILIIVAYLLMRGLLALWQRR